METNLTGCYAVRPYSVRRAWWIFAKVMYNSTSDNCFRQKGNSRIVAIKMETIPMNPWLMSAEVAV